MKQPNCQPTDQINDLAATKIVDSHARGVDLTKSPVPIWCPSCKSSGHATVLGSWPEKVAFSCDLKHHEFTWPVPPMSCRIVTSINGHAPLDPDQPLDRLKTDYPSFNTYWSHFRVDIPPCYPDPRLLFSLVAQLPPRNIPLIREQERILKIAQKWIPLPKLFALDPLIAWNEAIPDLFLDELAIFQPSGAFVFPSSLALGFMGFTVVKAGFHQIRHKDPEFFVPVDTLLLLMVFPEQQKHLTAEITLRGRSHDFVLIGSVPPEYEAAVFQGFKLWCLYNSRPDLQATLIPLPQFPIPS